MIFKEYRKLNNYGNLFGLKREWLETDKKYSERLKAYLLKETTPYKEQEKIY